MVRDYKPASRRGRKRRGASGGAPGWAWGLAGLSAGLLVALLVWLKGATPPPRPEAPKTASGQPPDKPDPAAEKGADAASSKIRFSFYTVLKESEVMVPETELPPPGRAATEAEPAEKRALPPGSYKVQAGSFRHRAEAETRKAELALLGVHASIEPVRFDGQAWYRVLAGPYDTPGDAAAVRQALAREGIDTMVLRVTRR